MEVVPRIRPRRFRGILPQGGDDLIDDPLLAFEDARLRRNLGPQYQPVFQIKTS